MLIVKKSLYEQGFDITEPYFMALMIDKIGKRFFIRARTEKVLNRLIKKCVKRGAICEFKKEVI